ncbi:thioredoxin fold domain-containing protein [Reichenbachiella sp. 5M10]|uniref:thioredoxin family protein n=1 Tax=Reichenbachiella sp. 5M10 TaxID=1889772 RepID=UPI00130427BA|nr:thioredoxin fold domain-containing protein [Reichenbachiella sp. 5M10]
MMKTNIILLFFALVVSQGAVAQDSAIQWYSIEEAQVLAQENAKPIFVDFTAVWCGWCKKMDQTTFADAKVVKVMNEGYYPVRLDVDNGDTFVFGGTSTTAKSMAQSMGVTGLPTMVVIAPSMESHHSIAGYQKPAQFIRSLREL